MGEQYPVFAIVGASRFLRAETLATVLAGLDDSDDSMTPARFDGNSATIAAVLDEVRTISLLGDRRLVVVDDADAFVTANRSALERYCARPSDSGSLILLCNSMPKTTRLYKAIRDSGKVISLDTPKGRAVIGWAAARAQSHYGKRLTQTAAVRLVEQLGDSLALLDAELSKLAAYTGSRDSISPEDIETLTGHHREEKIFAVIDAIANGDPSGALHHWEQVLATDRAAPARAIAGLAWGVRRLHDARRDRDAGVSTNELSRRMFTDPATLQRRLDRFTMRQLEQQQQTLLEADLAVKTGAATVGLAIETFIVKYATAGSLRRETG